MVRPWPFELWGCCHSNMGSPESRQLEAYWRLCLPALIINLGLGGGPGSSVGLEWSLFSPLYPKSSPFLQGYPDRRENPSLFFPGQYVAFPLTQQYLPIYLLKLSCPAAPEALLVGPLGSTALAACLDVYKPGHVTSLSVVLQASGKCDACLSLCHCSF